MAKLFGREIKAEDIDVDKLLGSPAFQNLFGVNMDKKDHKEATLMTCLRILSENVGKLPIKVHKGRDVADDHRLNTILRLRPNKLMTASTLWKTIEYQRNWYGYSVVVKGKNKKGEVISLIPLKMDDVTMYVDDIGLLGNADHPVFFTYAQGGNEYQFRFNDVLYFVGMTSDGISPMPIIDHLKTLIDNAVEANKYTNNYLKNGLHSRGVVKYIGDLSEQSQKDLQARMTRVSGGIEKAGQLLPLPIGFDYQSISTSMADSQFVELQALSERQIASALGIKMHQLNSLERSTNSNIEHQQQEFYVDTLQPTLTSYEQEMTYELLTEEEIAEGYFIRFNIDAILRSQSKERAEYLSTLVNNSIMMASEARNIIDLPFVKGSDRLIVNGSYLDLNDVGKHYTKIPKGGEKDGQD